MLAAFAACKGSGDGDTTTASEVSTEPEVTDPPYAKTQHMASYNIHVPNSWTKVTDAEDADKLTLYAVKSIQDADDDTTTISISFETGVTEDVARERFLALIEEKGSERSYSRIGGILSPTTTYKDAGAEVKYYQAVNEKGMMVIEVRAEKKETKAFVRLVLQSISFR